MNRGEGADGSRRTDVASVEPGHESLREADLQDAIDAVDSKLARLIVVSAIAAAVVAWVLFEAPPGPAIGMGVAALLSAKKVYTEYRALSERRDELLDQAGPGTAQPITSRSGRTDSEPGNTRST